MTDGILMICAFLTFASVCSAAFVSFVCVTLFYKQSKVLDAQIAELPQRVRVATDRAVAQYAQPLKEFFDERGRAGAEPVPAVDYLNETDGDNNEDLAWLLE